jgi:tetratricopeptide (TPR) repeat protein
MSEKDAPRFALPAKLLLFLGIFLSVLILILVYGAGWIGLPFYVLTNYQTKNCDTALSVNKIYLALYPRFMQDKTLLAPIGECKQYLSALETEQGGHWQEAYDAYQAYTASYPNGLYAGEVHEHSAVVLVNIARDQLQQKEYEKALGTLNLVMSSYTDTAVSSEARTLFPSLYTAWGKGLRDSGNFEQAQKIFTDFKTWSQDNQDSEVEMDAQAELVKTYITWGMALQSEKRFEDALAKLDLAGSADPESEEVKTDRSDLFINWGNEFLSRSEYPTAVEKFKLAASGVDDGNARDALANGYIQWASDLRAKEDFLGALDELKLAETSAVTDSMKQSVTAAFTETYTAFSASTGPQARRAMKEALKSICEKHDKPELPIFGLDKDKIRAGVYGIEDKLPEVVTAKTPGEMHYVACIKPEERVITSDTNYGWIRIPGYNPIPVHYTLLRLRIYWHVTLRNAADAQEYAAKIFEGSYPPPIPKQRSEWGNGKFYGEPPSLNELKQWLLSVMK